MQDITYDIDNYRLNSRCGAIIIHDNKILFHKNPNEKYYATIGGRIHIGEDSESAIKREVLEETGKEIYIKNFFGIVENFFYINDKKYHEYLFLYEAEFINENDKKILSTIEPFEEHKKGKLQFEWVDISNLENVEIKPKIVKNLLLSKSSTKHLINFDI